MAFTNIYVPHHLFPARSQLVIISPLVTDDFHMLAELRLRGFHMLVISPNPVSFEAAALPKNETTSLAEQIVQMQRRVLLRRLRGVGIQVSVAI